MQKDEEADKAWDGLCLYVEAKYTIREVKRTAKDYPYQILHKIGDPKLAFKELFLWFMLEHKNPETGKTPLEEYVEEKVSDERIAKIMLTMGHIIEGPFIVARGFKGDILKLNDITGKSYAVEVENPDEKQRKIYAKGAVLQARIYPWLDGYKFGSISLIMAKIDPVVPKR